VKRTTYGTGIEERFPNQQSLSKDKESMKRTLQLLICVSALVWSAAVQAQDESQSSKSYTNSSASWNRQGRGTNDLSQSDITVNTNRTTDADNTAVNARDRNSHTVTPMDQGNSTADLNTTAQIRKQIIADKSMSVNAQNVKIITANGRVVLRGPVNSTDEKRHVCDLAKNVAGFQNVEDQLEVTTNNRAN
jgi:osmotically-inducible protein OsmY